MDAQPPARKPLALKVTKHPNKPGAVAKAAPPRTIVADDASAASSASLLSFSPVALIESAICEHSKVSEWRPDEGVGWRPMRRPPSPQAVSFPFALLPVASDSVTCRKLPMFAHCRLFFRLFSFFFNSIARTRAN